MNVFISHSSSDAPFVRRLASALSEGGYDVTTDLDLQLGESVSARAKSAIDQADVVIPVISSNASKSPWVSSELSLALAYRLSGGKKLIVPVIAERDVEPPFFLKDVGALDLSSKDRFNENVKLLVSSLKRAQPPSSQADTMEIQKQVLAAQTQFLQAEMHRFETVREMRRQFIGNALGILGVALGVIGLAGTFLSDKANDFRPLFSIVGGALGAMAVLVSVAVAVRSFGFVRHKLETRKRLKSLLEETPRE